jgi:hypothetical protein
MPRTFLPVLLPLLLAGCVSTDTSQRGVPPQEDSRAAFRAVYACIGPAAKALDDGRSDASTIAAAVYAACNSEMIELRRVYHLVDRDVIERSMMQSITRAVLQTRAARRA